MQKILVIDDDPLVRRTIGRVLARSGYETLSAADGYEGLVLFQREQPSVVITDIIMPDKEGIETILEIRRLSPEAQIIAVSGGARSGNCDYLEIAAKFGASEVLTKPFDSAALLDCVARCLDRAAKAGA